MDSERKQFATERMSRQQLLSERQMADIHKFDIESGQMGFTLSEILAADEGFAGAQSLSGSLLSLAHSNSTTSFGQGTTTPQSNQSTPL